MILSPQAQKQLLQNLKQVKRQYTGIEKKADTVVSYFGARSKRLKSYVIKPSYVFRTVLQPNNLASRQHQLLTGKVTNRPPYWPGWCGLPSPLSASIALSEHEDLFLKIFTRTLLRLVNDCSRLRATRLNEVPQATVPRQIIFIDSRVDFRIFHSLFSCALVDNNRFLTFDGLESSYTTEPDVVIDRFFHICTSNSFSVWYNVNKNLIELCTDILGATPVFETTDFNFYLVSAIELFAAAAFKKFPVRFSLHNPDWVTHMLHFLRAVLGNYATATILVVQPKTWEGAVLFRANWATRYQTREHPIPTLYGGALKEIKHAVGSLCKIANTCKTFFDLNFALRGVDTTTSIRKQMDQLLLENSSVFERV